jgi:hypothetical protein
MQSAPHELKKKIVWYEKGVYSMCLLLKIYCEIGRSTLNNVSMDTAAEHAYRPVVHVGSTEKGRYMAIYIQLASRNYNYSTIYLLFIFSNGAVVVWFIVIRR